MGVPLTMRGASGADASTSALAAASGESSGSAAAHIVLNVASASSTSAIATSAAAIDPAISDWRNQKVKRRPMSFPTASR
ncbi:hypothetical protein VSR69_23260 [Paraburkholderia phytofirmans]